MPTPQRKRFSGESPKGKRTSSNGRSQESRKKTTKNPRYTRQAASTVLRQLAVRGVFQRKYYTPWATGESTGALNGAMLSNPDWQDANRVIQLAWDDRRAAIKAVLRNPAHLLPVLVQHFPEWMFQQRELTNLLGRLVWLAHHGKKDNDLPAQLLKDIVLPRKPGGGSPDASTVNVQKYHQYQAERITRVLTPNHRQAIASDLSLIEEASKRFGVNESPEAVKKLQTRLPGYSEKSIRKHLATRAGRIEIACRLHYQRCKAFVEVQDIECVESGTSNERYAVQRTATQFRLSESQARAKLRIRR